MSDKVANFVAQYGDLAQKAGAELGVDPSIVLAQWGMESNFGTQVGAPNGGRRSCRAVLDEQCRGGETRSCEFRALPAPTRGGSL